MFGPTSERDYSQKINQKMRKQALMMILADKLRAGRMIFVEALASHAGEKTRQAAQLLEGLKKNIPALADLRLEPSRSRHHVYLASAEYSLAALRAFRNIPGVKFEEARNMHVLDALQYPYLIIDAAVAEDLRARFQEKDSEKKS